MKIKKTQDAKAHLYTPPVDRDTLTAREKLMMIGIITKTILNPERKKYLVKYYAGKQR